MSPTLNGKSRISPGDLIEFRILDTPQFDRRLRIEADGTVLMPIGGTVSVAGLTPEQASAAITTRLKQQDIMLDPHPEIFILEYAVQGVTVTGEVRTAGIYPLQGPHTILDMISAAGGVTNTASHTITVVHRDPALPQQTFLAESSGAEDFDLNVPEMRTPVVAGDTIVVGRSGVVYVVGDVARPGAFLVENANRLTILQAVALAEGINRTASQNHARLIRSSQEGKTAIPLDVGKMLKSEVADIQMHDGDILYIPSSTKKYLFYRGIEGAVQAAVGVATYRSF